MDRIESVKNQKVKQWRKLHTKKEREATGTFMIEGLHLVEEALKTKEIIKDLIVSEDTTIPTHWNVDQLNIILVTKEVLKAISDTETPQGVAAICEIQTELSADNWNKILFIDSVQDPGNLGTIIRTADAAGIDGIILGEGTVDHYNSKVIRSSQGSIFHLPIIKGNLVEWLDIYSRNEIPVYGTSLQNGVSYRDVSPSEQFCLIIGNEGSGVNRELLQKTVKNLYIPIYGGAESLNVAIAAGILLYHLRG
ncbi:TrmH family RNA methyltransferase [Metabacillus sediminilitoris]|uniref:RNA methyltransferase n=1 Tax=Metabacillus sediminilitoris TaxID=2567941 RepID=A0A4S4C2J3_9BACI|nr:RNA methyltransferase [Metabacillus sediminilitoris]QGQ47469.1 RNA methyltransferase [Metabacillus sediminilitoris]THF81903.1 RNA methyltransferase [Metabacillus sediminilitoris]